MRGPVHFIIEGLPTLRLAVEDQELAESLAGRMCVESSEHHRLSAATFDRFWTLARVDDYAHVSEFVAQLHGTDLQEMEVDGDDEAADWLRHAYAFRAK